MGTSTFDSRSDLAACRKAINNKINISCESLQKFVTELSTAPTYRSQLIKHQLPPPPLHQMDRPQVDMVGQHSSENRGKEESMVNPVTHRVTRLLLGRCAYV